MNLIQIDGKSNPLARFLQVAVFSFFLHARQLTLTAPLCIPSPVHGLPSAHPHVKLPSAVARLYLEDVEGAGIARGGLHLEDIDRHTAPRRQVHVSVQNGESQVPAGRVLS